MLNNDLKNIVVLKNLPSNIIDEAIIILKKNKNAKKIQYQFVAEKNKSINEPNESNIQNGNEYIVKEAECVISNYISKIEGKKIIQRKNIKNIEMKYKRLKLYSVCISVLAFVVVIKTFI